MDVGGDESDNEERLSKRYDVFLKKRIVHLSNCIVKKGI